MFTFVGTEKQLLVAALGIATSLLTGVIVALVLVYTGVAIYSFSLFFIIPVGALVAGYGSASGYYLGAKLLREKPAGGILFHKIASSIVTFFLIYYIPYFVLESEGVRAKDVLSFWQYLDIVFRHTALRVLPNSATSGELGILGYVVAVLQLAGIALGIVVVFSRVSKYPYCVRCSRYLKKTGQYDRYWFTEESVTREMREFKALVEKHDLHEALRFFQEDMGIAQEGTKPLRARLRTWACDGCGENSLSLIVSRSGKSALDLDRTELAKYETTIFTLERL